MATKGKEILSGNPHFLVLHPYYLSAAKAQEAVISILRRFDITKPAKERARNNFPGW